MRSDCALSHEPTNRAELESPTRLGATCAWPRTKHASVMNLLLQGAEEREGRCRLMGNAVGAWCAHQTHQGPKCDVILHYWPMGKNCGPTATANPSSLPPPPQPYTITNLMCKVKVNPYILAYKSFQNLLKISCKQYIQPNPFFVQCKNQVFHFCTYTCADYN